MSVTSEMIVKRQKVEEIWQKIFGMPMSAALMASEKEWKFYIALLDEKPVETK